MATIWYLDGDEFSFKCGASYIGKNYFNEAEIYEITKKIETRLSQLFFENYLNDMIPSVLYHLEVLPYLS